MYAITCMPKESISTATRSIDSLKKNDHFQGDRLSLVAATGNGVADRNCVHAGMRHNEEAEERSGTERLL